MASAAHAQTLLGHVAIDLSGGSLGAFSATPFTLSGHAEFTDPIFDPPLFSIALADGRQFTAADAGFTFTMNSSTPGFAAFAGLLSNGADDSLTVEHAGGGLSVPESYYTWTYAVTPQGLDFTGHSISSLRFTIGSLSFSSPIEDPNWTDYEYHFTISAYEGSAIPEPSTYAALCGVAVLGFAVWRRRARTAWRRT
ncbi:PEP-CTERM sorting domain-containing protein [Opitutus terrae]|uniref:Ice-binding protein C-terminal domain-containing protein n=1 Tax=Opitutus terrae (strain DSM 11246 / JCM 15787 / PB90-1) TaxID=452637 RepID=B1ZNG9_OPITP|nr:PEP-CTERM sorting domain-containing protein [Opitutus terrae]ACB74403.1 protein of unknown function DUF1555 [Opitutus terrae PB90-1]